MALPETMNVWHVSCLTPTHRLGVTPTGRSMPVRGRAVPALRDSATAVPRAIVDGTQGAEHPAIAGDDEQARNQGVTGVSQEESDSPNAWTEPRQAPAMPQGSKQPTRGIAQRDVRVGWHHWERSGPAGPADPSLAAGQVRILE